MSWLYKCSDTATQLITLLTPPQLILIDLELFCVNILCSLDGINLERTYLHLLTFLLISYFYSWIITTNCLFFIKIEVGTVVQVTHHLQYFFHTLSIFLSYRYFFHIDLLLEVSRLFRKFKFSECSPYLFDECPY